MPNYCTNIVEKDVSSNPFFKFINNFKNKNTSNIQNKNKVKTIQNEKKKVKKECGGRKWEVVINTVEYRDYQ